MKPTEDVTRYQFEHDITDETAEQYMIAARLFERFAPDVMIADLTDDVVNRWLAWLAESGTRGKRTIAGYRRSLLTLWRDAHRLGRATAGPAYVKRIKLAETIPEAWTAEEVATLLSVADDLKGRFRKVRTRRCLWWRAFILISWDTALRLSDVLELDKGDIWPGGVVVIVQSKTGHQHRCQLRPETLVAIDALRPQRTGRILLGWGCRTSVCAQFKRLAQAADLRGTSKWLRRSSATAVEAIQPGAAMRHLGHRTPGLAYRHYVDPSKLPMDRPLPPPIG